jgi:hypothetical protein
MVWIFGMVLGFAALLAEKCQFKRNFEKTRRKIIKLQGRP